MAVLKPKPAPAYDANGQEISPNQVYYACESFCGADSNGVEFLVRVGETVRGSHPAMVNASKLFIAVSGATSTDIAAAQAKIRFPDPGPEPDSGITLAKPLKDEDTVTATETFQAPVPIRNVVPGGIGWATGLQVVNAGDTFDRRHWAVQAFPDKFEPATKAKT